MALSINIAKLLQAQDNKSVTFDETTGAYHASTNPGGWGTPNPAYTDILRAFIQITNLKTDAVAYLAMTLAEAQAFADPGGTTPVTLDSLIMGQTIVGEDYAKINDGTYQLRYLPILAEGISLGATLDSVVITGSTLTTVFANYSAVYIDGKIYEIDKVNGFTSGSMNLKTPFESATGSYSAQTGPMKLLKFGLIGVGNALMIAGIGQIGCSSDTNELMDILLMKFGADANEQDGDFAGYQKKVDVMNAYFA